MSLLRLHDVGKIYVSENNVAVGIRGVNLTLDKGEFVAVTGKSGSGKSTLLNVISGMDSYEEGELFVEDSPTSHFLQADWEEYRQKYVSFIFQDYNIIDSFTVLENVELALMHIDDPKARRARALELIERVGLSSHVKHKGSRLSGGQKQRTVIARALAKDSPIILADEPTGNLDAQTSEEIIKLLHEVSYDKLLVIVTHNFEEVEKYATRHIRIFDGAVDSDTVIRVPEHSETKAPVTESERKIKNDIPSLIKKGATLGRSIFTSKPRLSLFLCLLMIIGSLGVFAMTSFCSSALDIFEDPTMFTHIDGRVVVTTQNGRVMSSEEVSALASRFGAKSYLHYDLLLDYEQSFVTDRTDIFGGYYYYYAKATYGEDFGNDIIGRYPTARDEVLLYIPIHYADAFGRDEITEEYIYFPSNIEYKVVGIKYFYDNNLEAKCLFTPEGFEIATAAYYVSYSSSNSIVLTEIYEDSEKAIYLNNIVTSNKLSGEEISIYAPYYELYGGTDRRLEISTTYYVYDYWYGASATSYSAYRCFESPDIKEFEQPECFYYNNYDFVALSPDTVLDISREMLGGSYRQASLFFEDDEAARSASELMQKEGYVAVSSDTTYKRSGAETLLLVISSVFLIVLWSLSIVFLAFFVKLCLGKTVDAFKGDMAIMRSMGIEARVIRIGMYFRMLISLVPALVSVIALAIFIFTSPSLNGMFTFLYPRHYLMIFIGMIILTVRVTHSQIKSLFGESVKKSLKGGATGDKD